MVMEVSSVGSPPTVDVGLVHTKEDCSTSTAPVALRLVGTSGVALLHSAFLR